MDTSARRPLPRFALPWVCCFLLLVGAGAAAAETPHNVRAPHVPPAVEQSKRLARVALDRQLTISISLPLRHQQQLDALIAQVADPASPNYRHYLTPQQFAEQFGPAPADYAHLIEFVQAHNLSIVHTSTNRLVLTVSGSIADIERAFRVQIFDFVHPMRGVFYAPDREPDPELNVAIEHISGLDNFLAPRPMNLERKPVSASAPQSGSAANGLFIGKDFRAAYAPGVPLTGSGQSVALVEFDGFYASDVAANFSAAGVTPVPVQTVLLDGFKGTPGSGNDEVTLDIMMAAYMAPSLTKIISYEGSFPDDVLNRIATDNKAKQISSSWGFPVDSTTEQIFKEFVAQGQSYLQASGDSGAYTGTVMAPSDEPNATIVGGTNLATSGAAGPWSSESAWSGSGGGISTVFSLPSYQAGMSMTASGGSTHMRNLPDVAANAGSGVYLVCNNGQVWSIGGTSAAAPLWAGFIALANQEAAANQKAAIGFLNPKLYSLGNGNGYSSEFHDVTTGTNGFKAVTGYDLATGWGSPSGQPLLDALAGSTTPSFQITGPAGTVSVSPTASANAGFSVQDFDGFNGLVTFSVSGLPAGVTASFNPTSSATATTLTLTASTSAVAGTYPITVTGTSGSLTDSTIFQLAVTGPSLVVAATNPSPALSAGGSVLDVLTVSASGLSSSVALSISGLPTGLTASFSPSSLGATGGASTLTLTASKSIAAGTYPLTVTATSGTNRATYSLQALVGVTPAFSLSVSPSTLTVITGGASNSATVSATTQNGFSGSVAVAASGIPSGVTASFAPGTVGGTLVFTVKAAANATPGAYTVTFTGSSGSVSRSTTLQLIVATQGFALSASPASLTLTPGGAGSTTTISVVGPNTWASSVAFSIAGLPTGVAASMSAVTSNSSTALTLAASATAQPGTYTVLVTGASGGLTATAPLQITVTGPSFLLSTSGTLAVAGGGSNSLVIQVVPQDGFTGSVSLAATGLPTGVTASLSPAATASTSRLTLTARKGTPAGDYSFVVTGTASGSSASVTIPFTVTDLIRPPVRR